VVKAGGGQSLGEFTRLDAWELGNSRHQKRRCFRRRFLVLLDNLLVEQIGLLGDDHVVQRLKLEPTGIWGADLAADVDGLIMAER
jgi:hypothetical protein